MATARDKLVLARKHIAKVHEAWPEPEWLDIALFAFYALEAAVDSAAIHNGIPTTKSHPSRVAAAARLRDEFGLPDVETLLKDLNDIRKSEAYGEEVSAARETQDVIDALDEFVTAVERLISASDTDV
jgi:hypothetical protein